MNAFAGVVREAARFAPALSARMAFAESEPKLIAEMFRIEAGYGCAHGRPPIAMRNGSWLTAAGASEWLIHS